MATEQERLDFCKVAAELGYTPSELLVAYKYRISKNSLSKEANWLTGLASGGLNAGGKVLSKIIEVAPSLPLKFLGYAAAAGAIGGTGLALGKNVVRNEYPHLFVDEGSPKSPELQEERLRQLIARYRNATDKINDRRKYEKDVQNPEESPMMRYEFGGFGD